jgi:NADPH-dependent 2,4-dienoyl-CoA reductase/sulfur reductase-like enzyme
MRKMSEQNRDVVIIGGGAAGTAAAIAAKTNGADSVLIIERNEELGGILPQCVHTGFGLHYLKENLTGPEYIDRFVKRISELDIEYKLGTMVLDLTSKKEILAINKNEGVQRFQADSVVLAMGCRERSRGALSIPGTRPAGIFTAGTAQRLMDIEGYVPGRKIVILGSGDIGLIMARRFVMEGTQVRGVIEVMPYLGGLDRNLQILKDFNIPLYLGHAATFIHGRNRVEGITMCSLDEDGRPKGDEEIIDCDTLVLSVGLIPENELSKKAGINIDPRTGGPAVDENMETSVKGIFACGNVVHVHDLVDYVTMEAEKAGASAAKNAKEELQRPVRRIRLIPGKGVRYIVPQIIGGEKPIEIYARIREPALDAKITVGDHISIRRRIVKPSETTIIDLDEEKLRKLEDGDEVIIDVTGQGGSHVEG